MSKNFKNNNPLNRLEGEGTPDNPIDSPPVNTSEPAAVQTEEPKEKGKGGRKKTKLGEYKTINISVSVDMLEKMEVAKLKYGGNLTAYVNAAIKSDLDANYQKYLELQKYLNS